ncbi:MAG: phosphate starvation-inducible protein PhoH [Acidiferrobacteraceae bacterium]|nr:phosphate starvation-inducible protein PhoH [Acidiferrobacteraceae bacterium]
MNNPTQPVTFLLDPEDNQRLADLCGEHNAHLKQVEEGLGVRISHRGHLFCVDGRDQAVRHAQDVLCALYEDSGKGAPLSPDRVQVAISEIPAEAKSNQDEPDDVVIRVRKAMIRGKSLNQKRYLGNILRHDINFGVGPAGTGKTYLAVACAVQALAEETVDRIVLVRPAVEAGERLGFLPGDIGQKVDPYLRPLYDALYEMLGFERVGRLMERHVIELAPLAYMRGRTLSHAFVILDEAQNTTESQMKMFLTRLGFGSRAVITGDPSQVDLPGQTRSGLVHAVELLSSVKGLSVTRFTPQDVVRHPLVQRVIEAYEKEGRSA